MLFLVDRSNFDDTSHLGPPLAIFTGARMEPFVVSAVNVGKSRSNLAQGQLQDGPVPFT